MSDTSKELVSGVIWSGVEKYSSMIVSLVISMILARLLLPEDFGVVAIATVIIFFLQIFCSMGIGPAIIQNKSLVDNDLNNIYSFTIYIGVVLSFVLILLSFPISKIYENDLLKPICIILSIQVFFSAANMVPNALMLKNKRFKDIARRSVILNTISGCISVIAAYSGLGVYSLLITPLISTTGIYLWNTFYYPLNFYYRISITSIQKIFSYSSYQFMFEFVNYFSRNLDKLLIGKYLSVTELGFYEKSYRMMQMPLNSLTSVVNPVLQPVLSEFQDNLTEMCHRYEKIIGFIAHISFPVGFILTIGAKEIIIILFGNQWIQAIPCFKILALSVPLQIILSTTGGIFQACNSTKNLFYVGLRNSLLTISGFLLAIVLFGSIESVAWAWTTTSIICFMSSFCEFYFKIFHSPILGLFRQLVFPFLNIVLLFIIYILFKQYLPVNFYLSIFVKILVVSIHTLFFMQMIGKIDFCKLGK